MALLKFKKTFRAKSILLKEYESIINQKIPENIPGFDKYMIKVRQSTKKKDLL